MCQQGSNLNCPSQGTSSLPRSPNNGSNESLPSDNDSFDQQSKSPIREQDGDSGCAGATTSEQDPDRRARSPNQTRCNDSPQRKHRFKRLGKSKRKQGCSSDTPKNQEVQGIELIDTPEVIHNSSNRNPSLFDVDSSDDDYKTRSRNNLQQDLHLEDSDSESEGITFPSSKQNRNDEVFSAWRDGAQGNPTLLELYNLYFLNNMILVNDPDAKQFASLHKIEFQDQADRVYDSIDYRERYISPERCCRLTLSVESRVFRFRYKNTRLTGKWDKKFIEFFPDFKASQRLGPHEILKCDRFDTANRELRNHSILVTHEVFRRPFEPMKCQFSELKSPVNDFDDWFLSIYYALKKNWNFYMNQLADRDVEPMPGLQLLGNDVEQLTPKVIKELFTGSWINECWGDVMMWLNESIGKANSSSLKPENLPFIRYLERKKKIYEAGLIDIGELKSLMKKAMSYSGDEVTEYFCFHPDNRFKNFFLKKLHIRTLVVDKMDQINEPTVQNPYTCLPEADGEFFPICYIFLTCEMGEGVDLVGMPSQRSDTRNKYIFNVHEVHSNAVASYLWKNVVDSDHENWSQFAIENQQEGTPSFCDVPEWDTVLGMKPTKLNYHAMNFLKPQEVDALVQAVDGGRATLQNRKKVSLEVAMVVCRMRPEWLLNRATIARKAIRLIPRFIHHDRIIQWTEKDSDLFKLIQEQTKHWNYCKSVVDAYIAFAYGHRGLDEDDDNVKELYPIRDAGRRVSEGFEARYRLQEYGYWIP